MTKEGRDILARIRTLSYIVAICYFIEFFHNLISTGFHQSQSRILYSFVAIIIIQIFLVLLNLGNFSQFIQNDKRKSVTVMISSRVKVFYMLQIAMLSLQAANCAFLGNSKLIDYGCMVVNVCNMVAVLQNLTILQRRSFSDEMVEEAKGAAHAKRVKEEQKAKAKKEKERAAKIARGEKVEDPSPKKKNKSNKSKKNYQAHIKTDAEKAEAAAKIAEKKAAKAAEAGKENAETE